MVALQIFERTWMHEVTSSILMKANTNVNYQSCMYYTFLIMLSITQVRQDKSQVTKRGDLI